MFTFSTSCGSKPSGWNGGSYDYLHYAVLYSLYCIPWVIVRKRQTRFLKTRASSANQMNFLAALMSSVLMHICNRLNTKPYRPIQLKSGDVTKSTIILRTLLSVSYSYMTFGNDSFTCFCERERLELTMAAVVLAIFWELPSAGKSMTVSSVFGGLRKLICGFASYAPVEVSADNWSGPSFSFSFSLTSVVCFSLNPCLSILSCFSLFAWAWYIACYACMIFGIICDGSPGSIFALCWFANCATSSAVG